jgi:hypothetical protein
MVSFNRRMTKNTRFVVLSGILKYINFGMSKTLSLNLY